MPAKTGVAYLAGRAGVFVAPVGIWGTENAMAQLCRLRRPLIHIRFGKPFHLPPLERGDRSIGLQKNTMRSCAILRRCCRRHTGASMPSTRS
jgi:1-acyl-sn-glycerol-3-phosphate acyltransferase